MFISINRKIIYSILSLFLVTGAIFTSTFYLIYGNKIQEEQLYSIQRNQQYIDLLYRNINLSREIKQLVPQHPQIIKKSHLIKNLLEENSVDNQINILSKEQKHVDEMRKSYDQRYNAIQESLKILGISTILIIAAIILLGALITQWVLKPINKISTVSTEVSQGNLDVRIENKKKSYFMDELDHLILTFNKMLDNLQNVLSEVQNKEAFLQSLIDSIPDGIRVIDKNYNIVIANKAYYKQVGHTQKKCTKCYEASQKRTSPCATEEFNCPLYEILQQHRTNSKVIQQFCTYPQRHLSINAAPLHSGKETYIVEAIRDLSDDINYSHQQKLSSLGFLSTSVAHEIKNHLGALRMILERVIDKFYSSKDDTSEEKKSILMIYNELVNSIAVPERLLKLGQTSSDNSQEINVTQSIKDVIALMDFEAKSHGINIELSAPPKEIIIKGNDADFRMAAINIIQNAIKAMENKGIITICIKHNKLTTISFSDTGIGISPENMNRIFDPFFSEGHSSGKKGTGLGLSITKSIVEKCGGNIKVSSTPGAGSCFTLSFPSIKKLAKK